MPVDDAGDRVLQITDISRISPAKQVVADGLIELRRILTRTQLIHEVTGKREDIFGTCPEWWELPSPARNAVVEVLPEPAASHLDLQVAIGGANESELSRLPAVAAEPLIRSFLNHSQKLGLKIERQLADFVQEERAAVGQRKRSRAAIAQ